MDQINIVSIGIDKNIKKRSEKYRFFFLNGKFRRTEVRLFNFGGNHMNYYKVRYDSQLLAA